MLSGTISSRRSWPSARMALWREALSSECDGGDTGLCMTLGNPSSFVPCVNTPFTQFVRKHKEELEVSHLGQLKPWATDPCSELLPERGD